MSRWDTSYNAWTQEDDFVEISVPEGPDGNAIRRLLAAAPAVGVRVEYGSRIQFHSDGRFYRPTFLRGYSAQEVADRCTVELADLPCLLSDEMARVIARH